MDAEVLAEKLAEQLFKSCAVCAPSYGLLHIGGVGAPLVHSTNGCLLFATCREERLLPTAVIRENAAEKIEAMEAERGSPIGRRERERMLDQVRFELLPRAFTRSQRTYGYIDPVGKYLIVDAPVTRERTILPVPHRALCALHGFQDASVPPRRYRVGF